MPKFATLIFFIFSISFCFSQDNSSRELKVFLDCNVCDNNYIKQNLGKVQFVRDKEQSDVHLFFVTQNTGSGGRLYEIDFIGKKAFRGIDYKISFATDTNMSSDDVRNHVLKFISIGLVRYWIENNTYDAISVNVPKPTIEGVETTEEVDPWNNWVYRFAASGNISGEETNKTSNLNLSVSAKRVTEENKFSMSAGFGENQSTFSYDGEDIVNLNNNKYLNLYDVISINGHWSAGLFGSIGTSTYSNKDLYWSFKPALEYNFFHYEDSAKKELTLSYRNGLVFNKYIERTVFGETDEYLWEHNVVLAGSLRQEWGNFYSDASFNQYLKDANLYSLGFYLGANVRVFKGFNFNIGGSYTITQNQLNLAAGDVSLEELLLQQQQLQSGYNYRMNLGISYSFGSIYNSIVNPRL